MTRCGLATTRRLRVQHKSCGPTECRRPLLPNLGKSDGKDFNGKRLHMCYDKDDADLSCSTTTTKRQHVAFLGEIRRGPCGTGFSPRRLGKRSSIFTAAPCQAAHPDATKGGQVDERLLHRLAEARSECGVRLQDIRLMLN